MSRFNPSTPTGSGAAIDDALASSAKTWSSSKIQQLDSSTKEVLKGNDIIKKLAVNDNTVSMPATTIENNNIDFTLEGNGLSNVSQLLLQEASISEIKTIDSTSVTKEKTTFTTPIILRGLPNGVRDTLSNKGEVTRKIVKKVLNGSESWVMRSESAQGVNTMVAYVVLSDMKLQNNGSGLSDRFNVTSNFSNDIESIQLGANMNGAIYLRINRSKLTTQDLAGIKAWLAANPTTVFYERTTPLTESVSPVVLKTYKNGSIQVTSTLKPFISAYIPMGKTEWKLEKQSTYYTVPDLPGGVIATHQELYAEYDALVAKYPGYITKTVLGTNAQGFELVSYKFAKPNVFNNVGFTRTKFGIMSGLHGDEKNPGRGLLRFMQALCETEGNNEILEKLKAQVDFYVLPCGNPTGWNNNTRNNGQDVNLNRNFTTNWVPTAQTDSNAGTSAASELETKLIEAWMANNAFDYYLDFHNAGHEGNVINWFVAPGSDNDSLALKKAYYKAISVVSGLWEKRYVIFPKNTMFGQMTAYAPLAQSQEHAKALGIKAALLETAWRVTYTDPVLDGPVTNTCAAEIIGNYVFEVCKEII